MSKNNQLAKDTFKLIFILLVIILLILPFATAFNEFLTRIVENIGFYKVIQKTLVPYISRLTAGIINLLPGLEAKLFPFGVIVNGKDLRISWNCLGWQSFLLLLVSLLIGFRGQYTKSSILLALGIGILGIFWLNIARILFTILLAVYTPPIFRIILHDYLAAFTTISWLFGFWWFAFKYILEEKQSEEKTPAFMLH